MVLLTLILTLSLAQRLHWVLHEFSLSRENRSDSLSHFQECQMSTLKQYTLYIIIDNVVTHVQLSAALTLSV